MRWLPLALLLTAALLGPAALGGEILTLKVGHVGHDHQIALFAALDRGETHAGDSGGVWFKPLKDREVYEMLRGPAVLGRVLLQKVGGGANMPAALARNEIEVGLGGVAATVAAIDQGGRMKIVAPCNCDGDMLMVRTDLKAHTWAEFLQAVRSAPAPIKIGYKAPRAVAYLIFMAALRAEGISFGPAATDSAGKAVQVILVNLQKGSNMVPSLAAGVVDGIVMNQPVVAVAASKGIGHVVADLRDLPPAGRWHHHPCCCVVATEAALAGKREAVAALVQAIAAGGHYVQHHPEESIALAARWTRQPEAVERISVPTVTYVSHPDAKWRKGMLTWFAMMQELGQFTGALQGLSPEAMYTRTADYSLLTPTQP